MEPSRAWAVVLGACVVLGVLVVESGAFNRDRPVYKWSPLWFNSHHRGGTLFKRSRDEPIEKWSPTFFDYINLFSDQKREGRNCGRENSICAHVNSATGLPVMVRCCGNLQCLLTGPSYTCTDPKTYEDELDGDNNNYDYNQAYTS